MQHIDPEFHPLQALLAVHCVREKVIRPLIGQWNRYNLWCRCRRVGIATVAAPEECLVAIIVACIAEVVRRLVACLDNTGVCVRVEYCKML